MYWSFRALSSAYTMEIYNNSSHHDKSSAKYRDKAEVDNFCRWYGIIVGLHSL